jgi:site-specific recombinase XerD
VKLSNALDNFIYSCQLRGLSKNTERSYFDFVTLFIKYNNDIDVSLLTLQMLQNYIVHLNSKALAKSTIATYIRHLKIFVKWLEENEYIEARISKKIKVPKSGKRNPRIYSDEEIRMIFDVIDIKPQWLKYRNCSIIALMLDSGLRQNEVCTLLKKNIDFKQNIVMVNGKGNKERFVPLGELSTYYLNAYLKECPYMLNYAFATTHGEPLSRNSVKLFVSKLSQALPFEFSSHKLRHNFATNYCLDQYETHGTVDIYRLMALLGHEDISTTRRYLHLANQILATRSNISHLDKVFLST